MILQQREALFRLVTWREVAAWLDHTALEFVVDATTQDYLVHVAQCVRDEAERRYAERAGLVPVSP